MNWNNEWPKSLTPSVWPETFDPEKLKGIKPNNISIRRLDEYKPGDPGNQIQSGDIVNPKPTNQYDELDRDQLLILWNNAKDAVERAKENEMELRKYIADRAFPNAEEGTNTIPLENGYELKLNKKFNYKLNSDNAVVEATLDKIAKTGNQGSFIADRLVSWKASFLLTEYRSLVEAAEAGSNDAQEILALIGEMLVVEDAAPELKIKEPKKGKK